MSYFIVIMFSLENHKILVDGSEMFHVKQSPESIDKFVAFSDNLLLWNQKYNLTGISDEREIIIKHFLDSLSLASLFNFKKSVKIFDLGTGAGFPGIPLYICFPKIDLYLNESIGKKVKFLDHINSLVFPTNLFKILHGRAEDLVARNLGLARAFDAVCARAVGRPDIIIPLAIKYLKPGGIFLGQFGPNEDLGLILKNVNRFNARIISVNKITLPFSDYKRQIVLISRR